MTAGIEIDVELLGDLGLLPCDGCEAWCEKCAEETLDLHFHWLDLIDAADGPTRCFAEALLDALPAGFDAARYREQLKVAIAYLEKWVTRCPHCECLHLIADSGR